MNNDAARQPKHVQFANEETVWVYAAVDIESKVVLDARLSRDRGREPPETLLTEHKENQCVEATEFFVDGMGYFTALSRTNIYGHLDYSERNFVEKLFQTYTMRIEQFHETWNGSQTSAEVCLTAYTACYNHHRPHQALENQSPITTLKLEGSI